MSIFTKHRFIGPDQIRESIELVKAHLREKAALIGGVALAWYGSPRLTKGLDVAAFKTFDLPGLDGRPFKGGMVWEGPDGWPLIKVLAWRDSWEDDYVELYEDAIRLAIPGPHGFPVATPEYLAAMKLTIHDLRHRLDLKWLLGKPGLVDRLKLRNIVRIHVGGRFALDALEVIEEEVALDIAMDKDRSGSSYP